MHGKVVDLHMNVFAVVIVQLRYSILPNRKSDL